MTVLLSLTACSSTDFGSSPYREAEDSEIPSDTLIAENSLYRLELTDSNMGFVLTEKATGKQWSSTPADESGAEVDELGMPIKKHPRVESVLSVECKNFISDETNTYNCYTDALQAGKVVCKAADNGITVDYYFSEAQVMIPLECTLTDMGVKLSVNPEKILENDNKVISISIAPFFCGVKNDTENSYLFVPSGSGAIVGTAAKSQQGDSYSAQIYGYDPAIDEVASISNKEPVRLGVFGSKAGDKAMCAVVDGSPESAWINLTSGSETLGYSSCYATFQMRGYTNHTAQLFSYEKVNNVVYGKKMINKPISVTFCPLSGEDADYSGMARLYREYLIKEYGVKASCEDIPLNIRMLGGTQTTKSFLGIPYTTTYAATTLNAAEKIIKEIKTETGADFSVQLKGFGESGTDEGKIAGNFTVNKSLGSLKELKALFGFGEKNKVDLYFDFDMEKFAGGFGSGGAITNAGEQKAVQYHYDIAVRDKKTDTAYYLLSPVKFADIANKIIKKANKYEISGISLDTLSQVAYSDYKNKKSSEYYSKNGFPAAADGAITSLKSENKRFMASGANLYSAVTADIITESPVTSEKNQAFLYDVPFYQMVFKGSVPIAVQSVNLAADPRLMLLKAVESGAGLGYTVIDKWDNALINSDLPYFYNSVFDDIKDGIFEDFGKLSDYFKKISGQHIVKHTVYETGLRETVFENGVCVYVNITGKTLDTPKGELASYEYLITEKSL